MSRLLEFYPDGQIYEIEDEQAINVIETEGQVQLLKEALEFTQATTFIIAPVDRTPPDVPQTRDVFKRINQNGLNLIKSFEGFEEKVFKNGTLVELKAYDDSIGIWTIGYGHTKGVTQGMRVSPAKAEEFLREDLATFEKAVADVVKVSLNEDQFAALVAFSFNIGADALFKSTLLKLLNKGDFSGAANEFPKWNKAGGQPLLGLTRRRKAEQALFLGQPWQPFLNFTEVTVRILQSTSPTMQGEDVRQVQHALVKAGFSVGTNGPDGDFGPATAQAVKAFQNKKGLTVDGKVGAGTRQALGL